MDVLQTDLPYFDPIRSVLRRGAFGNKLAVHLQTDRSFVARLPRSEFLSLKRRYQMGLRKQYSPFLDHQSQGRAPETLQLGSALSGLQ